MRRDPAPPRSPSRRSARLEEFIVGGLAIRRRNTYVNDRERHFSVSVANVAPTVKITAPTGGGLFKAGASVSLSASFSDAGTADTHTCKIAWGDGTTSTGTVTESGGAGTCTATHPYASGRYTITVR